jgi:RHS repeat-associated protein
MNAGLKRFLKATAACAGICALVLGVVVLSPVIDIHEVEACTPPTYYTLTVAREGGGGILDPDIGPHSYISGATPTVEATSAGEWAFDHWEVGGVEQPEQDPANEIQVTMDSNKTVTGVFLERFTVTVAKSGTGSVDPDVDTYTRTDGDTFSVTASTTSGDWAFSHWELDDVEQPEQSPATEIEFEVEADVTVKAVFVEQFTLTASVSGVGGSVDPASGVYDDGEEVEVTATPDQGYRFDEWTGDVPPAIADDAEIELTMDQDRTIQASFVQQYTLTTSLAPSDDSGGTVSPDSGPKDAQTTVTVTATPNTPDWRFSHWTGDVDPGDAGDLSIDILMDADKAVHAVFLNYYTLQSEVVAGGTIAPSEGRYELDEVVPLTATPDTGWRFDAWGGDVDLPARTEADNTVTMDGDKTVSAQFVQQFTVTTETENDDGYGVVTPSGCTEDAGTLKTFTASTSGGTVTFTHWEGLPADEYPSGPVGPGSSTANPLEDLEINGDYTLTAVYDASTVNLTTAAEGPGTVTPSSGTVPLDSTVIVEAEPDVGATFFGWEDGDGNPIDEPTTILSLKMDESKSVTGVFIDSGEYALTVYARGDGSTTPGQGTQGQTANSDVTVTATVNAGSYFLHWEVDGEIQEAQTPPTEIEVTMDADKTVTAVFIGVNERVLTIEADGNGTTEPEPGAYGHADDAEVTVLAISYEGNYLDHWEIGGVPQDPPSPDPNEITVTMDADKTLTAVFASLSGNPQEDNPGDDPDYEEEQETEEGDAFPCEGEPVNTYSGEYIGYVEDFRVKGRGMDLVWARTYRSIIPTATAMGTGWDHSYNVYLKDLGTDGAGNPQLLLHRGDRHRRDTFTAPIGTTQYTCEGFFGYIDKNVDDTFTLTFGDHEEWSFTELDATTDISLLTSMVDRNGNTISLDYDVDDRLESVTDTLGRVLTVHYENSRLDYVQFADDTSRRVVYTYYADGDSDGFAGDLKTVRSPTFSGAGDHSFPDGKTLTYTYYKDDPSITADDDLRGNLLTVTDGEGQTYLVNTYGTDTGDSTTFDKVVEQQWGDSGETFEFSYPDDAPPVDLPAAARKAVIASRRGCFATRWFAATGHTLRKQKTTATGTRQRDAEYNSDGKATAIAGAMGRSYSLSYSSGSLFARGCVSSVTRTDPVTSETTDESYEYLSGWRSQASSMVDAESLEGSSSADETVADDFVTKYTDAEDHVTEHTYDGDGNRLSTVYRATDGGPILAQHDFTYTAGGQLETHTHPANGASGAGHRRIDKFFYENQDTNCPDDGYLSMVIVDFGGLNLTTTFTTNAVGAVTSMTKQDGNTTYFEVDTLNKIYRVTAEAIDADGIDQDYQWDTYYDGNDRIARIETDDLNTYGLEYAVDYTRDILGAVTSRTEYLDGSPVTTSFAYDEDRNLELAVYPEGNKTQWFHNDQGFVSEVHEGCSGSVACTGNGERVTRFTYDDDGNLLTTEVGQGTVGGTLTDSRTYTGEFDGFDRLVNCTDPEDFVLHFEYDDEGNILEETLTNLAETVTYGRMARTYDGMNRLATETVDVRDLTTGALITAGGNGQAVTTYAYNDLSQVVSVTNENGHDLAVTYDDANRVATEEDDEGNEAAYAYTLLSTGHTVTKTQTLKSDLGSADKTVVTKWEYDTLGRLIRRTESRDSSADLITKFYYDFRNNLVKSVDAKGTVSEYTYDDLGRLTGVDEAGTTSGREYDLNSRLVGQTDANGKETTYAYDDLNRLTTLTHADTGAYSYSHNIHGDVTGVTDPNATVFSYAYDDLGQMISRTVTSVTETHIEVPAAAELFAYDAMGNVVSAENDHALVTREFASTGSLLEDSVLFDGDVTTLTATAGYSDLGNLTSLSYPGGRAITHTHDDIDRLSTISDTGGTIATYGYIGVGHVERLELGNDVWTEHAYDDRLRPTSITHNLMTEDPPGTWTVDEVVDARTLQWDAVHNKTQRADVRTGGPEREFDYAYDDLSRLTTATLTQSGSDTVEWAYTLNDVGSRSNIQKTVESDPPVVTNHTFTSDADTHAYLTTPGWTSREYDDNGSLLLLDENLGTEVSFKYNHLDQMTERTDASGTTDYVYDALGRRIARTVSSVTTRYLYFGDRVVEERDDSAVTGTFATTATYVYGRYVDEVLQMQRGGNAYYYHADDQYNVFALTDATGAVVERYDYGDFGQPEFYNAGGTPLTGTAYGNPYLFTGRRWDDESGLYYYRSRYYDPAIGQFTTRDPIGVWGDPLNMGNAYAYCGNNPWSWVDPYGDESWWHVFLDAPGTIGWCLGKKDPSIGQPITAEQVRVENRARKAKSGAGSYSIIDGGYIPRVKCAMYPESAQYAVNTGLKAGGTAITFASLPVSFMACPAVVFTGDGLFLLCDSADGHVNPMYMTFWVLGGTLKARQITCGDDLARISKNTVWQQHHWWPEELGGDPKAIRVAIPSKCPNLHTLGPDGLHVMMHEFLVDKLRAHDWEHAKMLFKKEYSRGERYELLREFYKGLGMKMPDIAQFKKCK